MGRGGAEEFVLEFDEPDHAPDTAEPAHGPAGRRRKRRGVPRPLALWAGVAVLLVVAGILVAPPPPGPSFGVSPGWASAPVPQWSVPVVATEAFPGVWVQEDHVLVVGKDRLDAYDRADGTHRWSVTDVGQCMLAQSTPVCVSGSGADAHVAIVGDDGTVREVVAPGAVAATLHQGDLAVLTGTAVMGYELTLHAGLDLAEPRWSAAVEAPDELLGGAPPGVLVWGDLLLVTTTGALFRARNGEQVPGNWAYQLQESPLIGWGGDRMQQILPGTDRVMDLPAIGWTALIDDGAPPQVTIVQSAAGAGDSVEAVNEDGQVLWQSTIAFPIARLGDVLLMTTPGDSMARAPTSGDLLWSSPVRLACPCRGDSSGLLMYAYEIDTEGAQTDTRLIGLRVADGEVLWEVPLADGAMVGDADDAFAVLVDQQLTLYSRT
ncbi:PQQ-binding-like beta-propeller repeat protein [Occultella kanbiaonis]|uniref:PQQ-binding-like beta-propeller repeat protein n=1 Tax=Occultella kanbiaonis TaxID=2675754 RepID=UPI0013D06A68|nr:PQQ-binding-like beta-propeller repeat protein [Occultella kanbiaonis]